MSDDRQPPQADEDKTGAPEHASEQAQKDAAETREAEGGYQ